MPLTGHEHDVATASQSAGRLNGRQSVGDAEHTHPSGGVQPSLHLANDGVGILKAGVVRRKNKLVALSVGLTGHQRTFARISIATGADHGDHAPRAPQHFVDTRQHVGQRIRRVGIINDGRKALGRRDRLEPSGYGPEAAQRHKHPRRILA